MGSLSKEIKISLFSIILYYTCFLFQKSWIGKDSAVYVLLGRALAQGNGYFNYFFSIPSPHALYPPGYPFILAAVIRIFGENLLFLRMSSIAFSGLSLVILLKILSSYLEEKELFFTFLLFALNPLFLNFTHQIYSEAAYVLFSWLGIYIFLNNPDILSAKKTIWGALAILAGLYCRVIGISLYCSLLFYLLIKRRYRQVILVSFLALIILPWIIYMLKNSCGYSQVFMMKDVYNPLAGEIKLIDIALRLFSNIKYYTSKVVSDLLFYPYFKEVTFGYPFFPLKIFLSLLFSFLLLVGFYFTASKSIGIIEIYILFYMIILLFHSYHDERFLLPIYPFLLRYLLVALKLPKFKFTKTAIILVLLFALIPENINMIKNLVKKKDFLKPAYSEYLSWIKNNTRPDSIIMSGDSAGIYYYTGRKGAFFNLGTDYAELLAKIREKRVNFILIEKESGLTIHENKIISFDKRINSLLEKYPDYFSIVYQTSVKPEVSIYRVNFQ